MEFAEWKYISDISKKKKNLLGILSFIDNMYI